MSEEGWVPWEEVEPPIEKRGKPWLWIGLPFFLGALLIAGAIATVLGTGFGATRTWADISTVLVLLPLCLLGFLPLIALFALSYGIGRMVGWLPDRLRQVDRLSARAARETRRGGELLVRPWLILNGFLAMMDTFLRGLIDLARR